MTTSAPDSFRIKCPYCKGEHVATAGTYHDGSLYYGHMIYGVTCPATTPYGVCKGSEFTIVELAATDDDDNECEGHESLSGAHMGESVFCDGSCL